MKCKTELLGIKLRELENWFEGKGRAAVAFSGGVDSTLVAAVASRVLGDNALAVTVATEFTGKEDIRTAISTAGELGIKHEIINFDLPSEILGNPPDRCYLCKRGMMEKIIGVARRRGIEWIVDGTNADDISSDRPGLDALRETGIKSPLAEAGIHKAEVRAISALIGMDADRTSNSCLATRFPFNYRVTKEEAEMVEAAEACLRRFGFRTVRVRTRDKVARIEVSREEVETALRLALQGGITQELKGIGYRRVSLDLEGYQPGCNEVP
ncbi:MAG: ATP-dependent sacrificial sulfur transferase LarE [Candidatus Verstraetearchaeota archaeon]|nr:ATP-dependent sacrificial sulfur transferase LarE [Candidatus Verstraetearchaeota archaeon]